MANPPTSATAREAWAKTWRGEAENKKELNQRMLQEWHQRWVVTQPVWSQRHARPPDPKVLDLHKGFKKAESSIVIQAHTEKIGLAQFLCNRGVPGVVTGLCSCGVEPETARHVTLHCNIKEGRRGELRREDAGRTLDYRWLIGTNAGAKKFSRWLIQSGRLQQFSLVDRLLYS